VQTSDLHAMQFDPVSGRHNFITVKDPNYFKQQIDEMHATDAYGLPMTSSARCKRSNGAIC
jgi:NAD(P)H dehydrogenase (quinone)